jgi:hypothetical protein
MTTADLNRILDYMWHTNDYEGAVDNDFVEHVVIPAMERAYNKGLEDAAANVKMETGGGYIGDNSPIKFQPVMNDLMTFEFQGQGDRSVSVVRVDKTSIEKLKIKND